jgi:hypothetical protein
MKVQSARTKFLLYPLILSIILITIILVYAIITYYKEKSDIIGYALVNGEFPPPSISPIYHKPITWLMILVLIAWFSFIELVKSSIDSLRYKWKFIIMLICFVITSISFYEILFNFMLWGSMLTHADTFNPDSMINTFPFDTYKINLVFATKMFVMVFICNLYTLLTFMRMSKNSYKE